MNDSWSRRVNRMRFFTLFSGLQNTVTERISESSMMFSMPTTKSDREYFMEASIQNSPSEEQAEEPPREEPVSDDFLSVPLEPRAEHRDRLLLRNCILSYLFSHNLPELRCDLLVEELIDGLLQPLTEGF